MSRIPQLDNGRRLEHDLRLDDGQPARLRLGIQTIDMANANVTLVTRGAAAGQTRMLSNQLIVDPNGAGGPQLRLPPEADLDGILLVIYNNATAGSGEAFSVRDDTGGTVVAFVDEGETAVVVCDGTSLFGFVGNPAAAAGNDFGAGGILTDAIVESTAGAGVTITGQGVYIGTTDGLRLNDNSELRFGTPGTDVVFTPDGTDVVITATGDLVLGDDVDFQIGTSKDALIRYVSASNRVDLQGAASTAGGAAAATAAVTLASGARTKNDVDAGVPGSGAVVLESGVTSVSAAATGGASGALTLRTGATDSTDAGGTGGASGAVILQSGNAAATAGTSGASGSVTIRSGTSVNSTSGALALSTGNVTGGAGNSGAITLTTGTSAGGTRGAVTVTAGAITYTANGAFDLDATGALSINSSAGVINVGDDVVAQNINLGTGGARTIAVGSAAATAVNVDAIAISIDSTDTTNFTMSANNAANRTLTIAATNAGAGEGRISISATDQLDIGDATGTARFDGGNLALIGVVTLDLDCSGVLSINSSGGVINIGDDAVAQAINIGTGAAARTITVGNVTGATAVVVNAGTGASSWTVTGAGTFSLVAGTGAVTLASNATDHALTIGSTTGVSAFTAQAGTGAMTLTAGGIFDVNATGAVTIDSSGGTIGIGTDAVAQAINIGTGAAARTVTIGNATGASSVVLNAGTGNIDIGTTAQARTINIGTGAAVQTISIGTSAAAHVIAIGSSASASLSLEAGVGNLSLTSDTQVDINAPTVDLVTQATNLDLIDSNAAALVVRAGSGGATVLTIDTLNGAEAVDVTASLTTTQGVAGGTELTVGGRAADAAATGSAVSNTTAETASATVTVPANTLTQGKTCKVTFGVRATATNGTDTMQVRLRLGGIAGTVLIATTAVDVANDNVVVGHFEFTAEGAPGAAVNVTGVGWYTNPAAAGAAMISAYLNPTARATNGALDIVVSIDWNVANVGNSAICEYLRVEYV